MQVRNREEWFNLPACIPSQQYTCTNESRLFTCQLPFASTCSFGEPVQPDFPQPRSC
jgi:hypothetical protein